MRQLIDKRYEQVESTVHTDSQAFKLTMDTHRMGTGPHIKPGVVYTYPTWKVGYNKTNHKPGQR